MNCGVAGAKGCGVQDCKWWRLPNGDARQGWPERATRDCATRQLRWLAAFPNNILTILLGQARNSLRSTLFAMQ
jgi:hypothetical protein